MLYAQEERFTLYHGDNREVLKELADNSIDSIVTDPPYELGFMGKKWDASGIAFNVEVWQECLRVLKPGGHLLAFSGSRTYHRMAVAIEDAGFEIRDQIMWIYGSGFPKSHNISKGLDKAAGVEREILGIARLQPDIRGNNYAQGQREYGGDTVPQYITKPATDEAKQWQGWGTALKPAHEPIVVARKPLIGTVAANVLTYGTGGLNIDASRVGRAEGDDSVAGNRTATFGTQETQSGGDGSGGWEQNTGGRWPANVIHDGSDEVVALFPNSKGFATQNSGPNVKVYTGNSLLHSKTEFPPVRLGFNDDGSAARFFYCAKASKRDRNEGLEGFDVVKAGSLKMRTDAHSDKNGMNTAPRANHHPTVKPTDLMRYLCRLITPPNGTVLDPFMGSGSTGKAAIYEGFNFIGIELTDEYLPIAKARIEFALADESDKLL
jgi:site-specific DNA-methyltransferase (adenine-specific)